LTREPEPPLEDPALKEREGKQDDLVQQDQQGDVDGDDERGRADRPARDTRGRLAQGNRTSGCRERDHEQDARRDRRDGRPPPETVVPRRPGFVHVSVAWGPTPTPFARRAWRPSGGLPG
jgi:hypothetical protein